MTVIEIPLTRGAVAIVDEIDADFVKSFGRWHLTRHGYPARGRKMENGTRGTLFLHRVIADRMGLSPVLMVDHISRDKRDNRRANLRSADFFQGTSNRRAWSLSGFKGVSRQGKRFCARIRHLKQKQIHLGTYDTPLEAALAYDRAARELHGEFAVLDFPDKQEVQL